VDIRHRDNGKVIETVDIAVAAVRVHTFSNLIPATRYQVSVTGIWGGEHQGRPGRLVNVNTSGPAPTRLALTGRPTNTTVTFTWQQPVTSLMIAGYEVRKENANNPTTGSWIPISPEDSNNRRWTDVNLNPGVAVRYRVRALLRVNGEVHPGNPSPVLSVTPPGGRAPGGVRARVNSPTELTVTWNFMPEVHSYNVFLLPHQGITPIEHRPDIPGGATRRVQFTNLDPDTRYRVRVEGVWNVSTSDEEDLRPGRAATVSVRTTGPAPRNLRAVSLNNDSLRLTWNPVHDPNVTCYRITRTIGNDMTTAKVYEIPVAKFFSNGNSFVDEKLSPGDRFRYTVQAQWPVEVASGENLYATVIPGAAARVNATIQGPAPGSVRVTRHGPTNLTVFWSAVRGTGLLGYNVYIRDVNDEDTAAIKPVRVPVTTPASHQFINLNPNTVYQIWVKSVWATQTGELESMHSSRIITTRRW